jgi:hypothetical protein
VTDLGLEALGVEQKERGKHIMVDEKTYARLYTIHYTLYSLYPILTMHHTLYTIHHTLYTILTIPHTHYAPYTIHHTPYTIHYTHYTPYPIYRYKTKASAVCVSAAGDVIGPPGEWAPSVASVYTV